VLTRLDALEDEPVDVLPGEPDLHPRPGVNGVVHGGRDEVVERPVEVRERHVDQDTRHRQLRSGVDGGRCPGDPLLRFAHLRPSDVGQRELGGPAARRRVTLVGLVAHGVSLAADGDIGRRPSTGHVRSPCARQFSCIPW
jgi:hypothetical protein